MALENFTRGTLKSGTPFIGFDQPAGATTAGGGGGSSGSAPAQSFGSSFFEPLPKNRFAGQTSGGSPTSVSPGPTAKRGVQITEFGRADFDAALIDWNRVYTEAQEGKQAALDLIDQFAPGGGFGTGLRQEAREEIGPQGAD